MRVLTKTLSYAAAALIVAGASPAFAQDTPSSETETPEANTSASANKKASDKNTLTLAPKGEWKLREYDYKCRLSRRFGSGEDATSLWIEQGDITPTYNLTMIGRPMRNTIAPQLTLQFDPEEVMTRNYIRSKSSKGRPVVSIFGVSLAPKSPAPAVITEAEEDEETINIGTDAQLSTAGPSLRSIDLNSITRLTIGRALVKPVSMPMDGFAENMAQLRLCTEKVVAALMGTTVGGTPALPVEQGRWAQKIQQNYPTYQLMKMKEGTVGVRITVGVNGRAVHCQVTRADAEQAFNESACLQLLRHARFKPATNADGEAVPAYYSTSITYRIN